MDSSSHQQPQQKNKPGRTVMIALWEWDVLTGALEWSSAADSLGYSPEALPRTMQAREALIHPEDAAGISEALSAHLQHGIPSDIEYRVQGADGRYRWRHDSGKALRDGDGRPHTMVGACIDISSQKVAEAALCGPVSSATRPCSSTRTARWPYTGLWMTAMISFSLISTSRVKNRTATPS